MSWLLALGGLTYPLLVWAGLVYWPPRSVALLLLSVVTLRTVTRWRSASTRGTARDRLAIGRHPARLLVPALLLALVLVFSASTDDPLGILLVPVLINAILLMSFGASLVRPPTVVETIARLHGEDLSIAEVGYCRSVTWIWCVFFVGNGTIAGVLATRASLEAWTLYCGLLSYIAMGMLFAGERIYRAWRFRRYGDSAVDALLQHVFPTIDEDARDRHRPRP